MTPEEIKRLRELWENNEPEDVILLWHSIVPELLDEVERLQAELEKVKAERDAWREAYEALDEVHEEYFQYPVPEPDGFQELVDRVDRSRSALERARKLSEGE